MCSYVLCISTSVCAMSSSWTVSSGQNGSSSSSMSGAPDSILHPHWHYYPPQPYSIHFAVGVIMSIMGLIAISTNTFVMYIFLRFRSLRTPGNLLVVNLAFSDMMLALLGFPLYAASSFAGHWPFGNMGCDFYAFSGATFGLMSINTMAAIAVDRYIVIVSPYSSFRRISYNQAYIMLSIVWVNSIGWSLPPLLGWSRYILEGLRTTCSFDYLSRDPVSRTYLISLYIGGFVIPVVLIIYCYSYIFFCVHQHERAFARTSKHMKTRYIRGAREATRRADVKTAHTAFVVVIVFCVAWSPYAIIALIGQFGDQSLLTPFVSAIPGILAKSSTIYNPLIYSVSHPRFRQKLRYLYFATVGSSAAVTEEGDTLHLERQTTRRIRSDHSPVSSHKVKRVDVEAHFCQTSGTSHTRTMCSGSRAYGSLDLQPDKELTSSSSAQQSINSNGSLPRHYPANIHTELIELQNVHQG